MADVDPKLVQEIAGAVIAALRAGGAPANGVGSSPVEIHAPIGQCTGDYSKFVELAGKGVGAVGPAGGGAGAGAGGVQQTAGGGSASGAGGTTPPGPGSPPVSSTAAVEVKALKGVVTVGVLKGIRGEVRLARGAMLTPLAVDYIKERGLSVMSDDGAAVRKVNGGGEGQKGDRPTYWWIEGQCPSVAKVVEGLRGKVMASGVRGGADQLKGVVKELAGLVKRNVVSGGVLFVGSAARAGCFANRCANLRAVVGTTERAVSEGIELLGANVLIVEYPQFGFKGMMPMVKAFVESMQMAPAGVQRELDELRNCG